MKTTAEREFWNGRPTALETVWTLSKRQRLARLVLYTHQLGWELRIESGDLLMTQLCRSDREIEDLCGVAGCDAREELDRHDEHHRKRTAVKNSSD